MQFKVEFSSIWVIGQYKMEKKNMVMKLHMALGLKSKDNKRAKIIIVAA